MQPRVIDAGEGAIPTLSPPCRPKDIPYLILYTVIVLISFFNFQFLNLFLLGTRYTKHIVLKGTT
jgi:hypothetical protein